VHGIILQDLVYRAGPGRVTQHQPAIINTAEGNHTMRAQIDSIEQLLEIGDIQRCHGQAQQGAMAATNGDRDMQLKTAIDTTSGHFGKNNGLLWVLAQGKEVTTVRNIGLRNNWSEA